MMKSRQTYFLGLLMFLLLAGCAQANSETPTRQPLPTDVPLITLTPLPNATATPTETITPLPPPTRRATLTSASDLTMTITPLASFTLRPTSRFTRTPTATSTITSTRYVRPPGFGGPTYSPTPIPFACTVEDISPDYGQVFKPRSDFIAKWRIQNTGANMWHQDDILIGYVSGTKMHNDTRGDEILSYTLYVNDSMYIQIHMKPPKEPGIYTESWGLRKTNKKEFFCKFSVTVEVVGK
jgi:hypothetical protein